MWSADLDFEWHGHSTLPSHSPMETAVFSDRTCADSFQWPEGSPPGRNKKCIQGRPTGKPKAKQESESNSLTRYRCRKCVPQKTFAFYANGPMSFTKLHFAKGTETPRHFGLFLLIHQRQSLLKRRREKLLSQNSFGFAVISWTELYWKLVLPFVPL